MKSARTYAMRALDAALYGIVAVAVAFVPLVLLSFAVGQRWTGVKTALFFLWLGFGVAGTWKLRPQPGYEQVEDDSAAAAAATDGDGDDEGGSRIPDLGIGHAFGLGPSRSIGGRDEDDLDQTGVESEHLDAAAMSDVETGFGALVHAIPPASLIDFAAEERASPGLRFMGASAAMFVVSFTMEVVFRVGYPGGPA